jgi:hypothetical protein
MRLINKENIHVHGCTYRLGMTRAEALNMMELNKEVYTGGTAVNASHATIEIPCAKFPRTDCLGTVALMFTCNSKEQMILTQYVFKPWFNQKNLPDVEYMIKKVLIELFSEMDWKSITEKDSSVIFTYEDTVLKGIVKGKDVGIYYTVC